MASLLGRVLVVAGEDRRLADAAAFALEHGGRVAVVSRTLDGQTCATVRFNADAGDPAAWERIAMHIEQHLGPVDGVVTDAQSGPVVDAVFASDLARRGHGAVLVVGSDDDLAAVATRLAHTLREVRLRPRPGGPGR